MIKVANCESRENTRTGAAQTPPLGNILILGLGNEFLKDDGVGIRVAETLRESLPAEIDVRSTSLFGLSLLDELIGRDKVLLIDSYLPEVCFGADILELNLDSFGDPQASCPHFVGLAEIREIMRSLDLGFPSEVRILAIPVSDPLTFSTELSSEVAARVGEAVERARGILQAWLAPAEPHAEVHCERHVADFSE